jgi:DNA polymerase II small subunit
MFLMQKTKRNNMSAEILIKFARKGIILSPEAYELIKNSENPINLS